MIQQLLIRVYKCIRNVNVDTVILGGLPQHSSRPTLDFLCWMALPRRSNAYKLLHHRVMHEGLFCCGTKFTLVFLLLAHLIMIFTKLVLLWEVHGIGTTHESSKRLPVWTCCDISHIITYTAWSIDDKTGIHRRSPWRRHYARIFEAPPNWDTL